jgi:hypothetical protein
VCSRVRCGRTYGAEEAFPPVHSRVHPRNRFSLAKRRRTQPAEAAAAQAAPPRKHVRARVYVHEGVASPSCLLKCMATARAKLGRGRGNRQVPASFFRTRCGFRARKPLFFNFFPRSRTLPAEYSERGGEGGKGGGASTSSSPYERNDHAAGVLPPAARPLKGAKEGRKQHVQRASSDVTGRAGPGFLHSCKYPPVSCRCSGAQALPNRRQGRDNNKPARAHLAQA